MKTFKYLFILLLSVPILFSCSNDDDGGTTSPYVDSSTTDYLRANRFNIFSMALDLYEKAGYIDLLDKPGVTVFMPTNYSIKHYMKQKQLILREEQANDNLEYTYENLIQDLPLFKDSLKMYIVENEINRSDLEKIEGEATTTKCVLGCDMHVALKKTKLYTENVPNSVNKYLYYTLIINGLDENEKVPNADKDVSNYCQTSGLITQTGILHVLRDEHPLFFNKRRYE